MRNRSSLCIVVLLLVGVATFAGADGPDYEIVQITDPQELAERGLGPDAVVHKIVPLGPVAEVGEEPDYGTTYNDYSAMMSTSFMAANSDGQWATSATDTGIYCQSGGTYMWYDSQVYAPSGAKLEGMRTWVYDSHATENVNMWVWQECQPAFGAGAVTLTELLDLQISNGSAGNYSGFSNIVPDRLINNLDCIYRVRVRLGNADASCNGSSIRLQKARAQWQRQISPAPATATFTDVPTGHPFFQHVEALHDSGITAGCSATQFCPDSPLTRGQMAVFLAKALGLHWDSGNL